MRFPGVAVMIMCATAMVSAGCGGPQAGSPAQPPAEVTPAPTNDPAVSAAADQIDSLVHPRYDRWYAGTVLDHQTGTVTVYRKPGSDLDAAARALVNNVPVRFLDARMSLQEMLQLVQEIIKDIPYWRGQGVVINGAGPLSDGSGVSVMTDAGGAADSERLSAHYRQRVVAERGRAVAATASPFRPSRSPSARSS